jgi:hypothetical protein
MKTHYQILIVGGRFRPILFKCRHLNRRTVFLCPIIKYLVIEPKKGKEPGYRIVNDVFISLG